MQRDRSTKEIDTLVMVAAEPNAYRETIAAAIRSLRPDIDVTEIDPALGDWGISVLQPDLVICSRLTDEIESRAPSWIVLYPDGRPDVIMMTNGRRTIQRDIDFTQLLRLVDETETQASWPRREAQG